MHIKKLNIDLDTLKNPIITLVSQKEIEKFILSIFPNKKDNGKIAEYSNNRNKIVIEKYSDSCFIKIWKENK